MHVVVPQHVVEEVNEMRLDERVLRQIAGGTVNEEILVERTVELEIPEVVFSALVFQVAPMDQLGKTYRQVLVNVPATNSKPRLEQIK